jgi:hypothetical protein
VVHIIPSVDSPALTGLYYDTYLPVRDKIIDSSGLAWYRVVLWGVLDGWIRADQTEIGDPPPLVPSTPEPGAAQGAAPEASERSAVYPFVATGRTRDLYVLRSSASVTADQVGLVDPGTAVQISSLQADDTGSVWYHVTTPSENGWVWGGGVNLNVSDPTATKIDGKPIANTLSGKGMWLPLPLLDLAEPSSVVSAAQSLGLTHVYLEVGSSNGGFYGRKGADRFLSTAHKAGLKVIAWMLTSLDSVPVDVQLCSTIATYKTPTGDSFDGIAPDVEYNMHADDVRTFSEILRTRLGANHLIVGVIYPAGSWIGQRYPVAGILSQSFNALAPMAYWHESKEDFTHDEVYRFIRKSVADVHTAVGSTTYPVAVIAQGYDSFGRNGAGVTSPSGAEALGAITAARDSGAIGLSFFQWGTMTPDEWDSLKIAAWTPR